MIPDQFRESVVVVIDKNAGNEIGTLTSAVPGGRGPGPAPGAWTRVAIGGFDTSESRP